LAHLYSANVSSASALHIGIKIFGHGRGLSIGKNTVINPECRLDARGGLKIGCNVSISRETFILTLTHDYNTVNFDLRDGTVEIGDDAWIGIRAIILPGVKIGKGAVVGAGSIVTKDVPDYSIVVGVPAKVVAQREVHDFSSVYYKPFLGGET
jgi:maltose O-acetyltransferase